MKLRPYKHTGYNKQKISEFSPLAIPPEAPCNQVWQIADRYSRQKQTLNGLLSIASRNAHPLFTCSLVQCVKRA